MLVLPTCQRHSAVFEWASSCMLWFQSAQAPDAAGLQQLVQPTGQQLMAANQIADNRRSPAFNHAKAAAEALQGLTWVVYSGPNCGQPMLLSTCCIVMLQTCWHKFI